MTRPVGVGVIGAGSAGRQHLAALAKCPQALPVALCDIDPDAVTRQLAECADTADLASVRGLTSVEQLLGDDRVEVVAVATPPGSHASLALQALEAGRAVLVEKPPALSVAELDRITEAADACSLPTGVMLQHRFRLPPEATARSWSASTVANVEVVRYRPEEHYAMADWRTEPRQSGGGLIAHLGVHYLDLACRLLGLPTAVIPWVDILPGTEIDQRVAFTGQFGSGARLSFIGTTGVDQRSERLAVYDDGQRIVVDNGRTEFTVGQVSVGREPSTASLRVEVYADLARAVREHSRPAVADLASARGVVQLLELVNAARPAGVCA